MQNTFLGVLIAICGNSLIGSSFAVMKLAHMRNRDGGSYLMIPMWWMGTLLMILGELGNLVAYSLGTRLNCWARTTVVMSCDLALTMPVVTSEAVPDLATRCCERCDQRPRCMAALGRKGAFPSAFAFEYPNRPLQGIAYPTCVLHSWSLPAICRRLSAMYVGV